MRERGKQREAERERSRDAEGSRETQRERRRETHREREIQRKRERGREREMSDGRSVSSSSLGTPHESSMLVAAAADGMAAGEEAVAEHAYERVCKNLATPDKLDTVSQLKARAIRKKAAADTRLKSTVQSQLDDVREGMQLLER